MPVDMAMMYLEGARRIEYRNHYHTAALMAAVLNVNGGKPKKSKQSPRSEIYTAEELLASYANPYTDLMTPQACRDILNTAQQPWFPSFVLNLIPSESELKRIANRL